MITEQQTIDRTKSIGGSDVAALLGLSPWKTPLDVYLEKTSQDIKDENPPLRLAAGNYLEPWVAHLFTQETGLEVNMQARGTVFNARFPHSHVHTDGVIGRSYHNKDTILDAVIELKTSENKALWEGDEIPKLYKPQVMHARLLTGATKAYLAVAIGFNEFKYYTYEPTEKDLENELKIQELIKLFWTEHVIPKVAPTPRFYEQAVKLYPGSDPETIKVTQDAKIIETHTKLKDVKTKLKDYKEEESQLKAILGDYLKEFEELRDECNKRMVTWKTQSALRFNTTQFKKEQPELYADYSASTSSRVMRLY